MHDKTSAGICPGTNTELVICYKKNTDKTRDITRARNATGFNQLMRSRFDDTYDMTAINEINLACQHSFN